MSLLHKAKDTGEDAEVMSVLGPDNGDNINLDDLGLEKNYGSFTTALTTMTCNDLMVEKCDTATFTSANSWHG
ncbi:uncharacterized protein FIBRA_09155 [Fibroporia radiculosa]|uniref:Uncharacterized protein n=1 Tax=Fibroporia radiculosa TaxID=599839 RepID=J4GY18_9APHY|nr:uncharacterized protein FIBRA_09155 [Fibroporia radiculosa]CCM06850.1 predicted protein [Fibroporia radiculosa]